MSSMEEEYDNVMFPAPVEMDEEEETVEQYPKLGLRGGGRGKGGVSWSKC